MYCLKCNEPLGKRQKKFCSTTCMNQYNAAVLNERRRSESPDRYKECVECKQSLNLNKFSLVEKWDPNSGTRDACKKCSAKLREVARRDRDWTYDAAKVLYNNAKARAKKAGIEFSLVFEDIVIPTHCPVFGYELKREGRETWKQAPSIDRIDNTRGYTKDNITIVSRRANVLKKDATIEELSKLSRYYLEHIRS